MDNQQIDIITEGGVEKLRAALGLTWGRSTVATHYKVVQLSTDVKYFVRKPSDRVKQAPNVQDPEPLHVHHCENTVIVPTDGRPTLILLWSDERESLPLPFPLNLDAAARFVSDWLQTAPYGREPDHDGDNGKGWRLFTEGWGHVADHHYAIVGVQPVWAMYGE